MATLNTTLPVVCDNIAEYNKLLNALISNLVPDVVSYVEHIELLEIDITINAVMKIP